MRSSWLSSLATASFLGLMALLSGCGGGSGSSQDKQALSVVPGSATVYAYADTPTILTIRGGVGPFNVYSDNPSVISFNNTTMPGGAVTNETIILEGPSGQYGRVNNVPYNSTGMVDANGTTTGAVPTVVNLTVRDSEGTQVAVPVAVMPSTLNNTLTITGKNPTTSAVTAGAVYSGNQGFVSVVASSVVGGALVGHRVRFDVVQGAYQLGCDTGTAGASCSTAKDGSGRIVSVTTTTDMNGVARAVITVDSSATTQIGLVRATDLDSGHTQTGQFAIVGSSLVVVPASVTIVNPTSAVAGTTACKAGATATYTIYGGIPPYKISTASGDGIATLSTTAVSASGGTFTATTVGGTITVGPPASTTGACGTATFSVMDSGVDPASGTYQTKTVTLINNAN